MPETSSLGRWLHNLDVRRAGKVVAIPGGAAMLHDDYPEAHDHNKLSLLEDTDGALLARAADDILGRAGRPHRLIEMRTSHDADATSGLTGRGYARGEDLVMTWIGARPGFRPSNPPVEEMTLQQRITAAQQSWSVGLPDASAETWRQLGTRITTVVGAAAATFLAVRNEVGDVVARTDLYEHGSVAQIEEVMTASAYRGKGLAGALVASAVQRALH